MPLQGNACPRPPGRRIPAQLWDASLEARRLREAAEAESKALLERARGEADRIREDAAAAGREDGLAQATEIVARAALVRDGLLASAEPQLVELAFEVARRVLGRVAERDRDAVVEVAARALEGVRHRRHVTLRAHPDDAGALREAEPGLRDQLRLERCIALVEDPSVGRGGVVVETEAGTVDARLAAQVGALRRALALRSPEVEAGEGLATQDVASGAGGERRGGAGAP